MSEISLHDDLYILSVRRHAFQGGLGGRVFLIVEIAPCQIEAVHPVVGQDLHPILREGVAAEPVVGGNVQIVYKSAVIDGIPEVSLPHSALAACGGIVAVEIVIALRTVVVHGSVHLCTGKIAALCGEQHLAALVRLYPVEQRTGSI